MELASNVIKKYSKSPQHRESIQDTLGRVQSKATFTSLVTNWKEFIPPGSRWQPGDPGDPACKICEGTGYVRLDLPVGHKYFGKVLQCDCVNRAKYPPTPTEE